MHHHDERDHEPREGTEAPASRERLTDRDWNAAGGDPGASPVLGGTASHQRPSFNDPVAGNPDPIIGTSGLAAEEIAGTRSSVAGARRGDEPLESPTDQSGLTTRGPETPARDSDEAAERARRRGADAETREG